jgi:hypothetical protein
MTLTRAKIRNWRHSHGEIIDINDTNAKVKMNNKIKVLNVNKLKLFLPENDNDINTELQDLNFNDLSSR